MAVINAQMMVSTNAIKPGRTDWSCPRRIEAEADLRNDCDGRGGSERTRPHPPHRPPALPPYPSQSPLIHDRFRVRLQKTAGVRLGRVGNDKQLRRRSTAEVGREVLAEHDRLLRGPV
jgi:hypothetical protein